MDVHTGARLLESALLVREGRTGLSAQDNPVHGSDVQAGRICADRQHVPSDHGESFSVDPTGWAMLL